MNKKGFGPIVIILIIVFVLIIIGVIKTVFEFDNDGSGLTIVSPYNLSNVSSNLNNEEQESERYKRQVLILAQTFSSFEKAENINLIPNEIDNFNKAIYAGSVAAESLNINSKIIKTSGVAVSSVYNLRIAEIALQDINKKYTQIIDLSQKINEQSSVEEFDNYVKQVGNLGGKMTYLILRSDIQVLVKFLEGVSEVLKSSGFDTKKLTKKICKDEAELCEDIFEKLKSGGLKFLIETIPVIDHFCYEISGIFGELTLPTAIKSTSTIENELQTRIIPESKKIAEQLIQK